MIYTTTSATNTSPSIVTGEGEGVKKMDYLICSHSSVSLYKILYKFQAYLK